MADPQTPEAAEPQPEVQAFNATTATDEALYAEYTRVRAEGQELSAKTDADPAKLTELAAAIPALKAEIDARQAKAADVQAARDAFSTLPELAAPVPVVPEQPKPQEPAVPEQAPAPVTVPSVSEMSAQNPVITPNNVQKRGDTITAHASSTMAGLMGLTADDIISGNEDVAVALIKNAQSFGRTGAPGQRQTMAQFRRNRGAELTVDTDNVNETNAILRHARNERRLDGGNLAQTWFKSIEQGGSLTAAAGWCAPSQNDYDLCQNWDAGVGLIDLPTVTVTRGGINYTDDPDFPTMYANAVAAGGGSNFLTEAQVIADTAKTSSVIPCPTFENRRLDVLALAIKVGLLQAAGYPEVVAAWDGGLRASHEAEMNRIIIADIVTRAGAATVLADVDAGTTTDSFTSALLAGVEIAAEDIRYRYHMAFNSTVEIVLPHWVLPQMRADISRRSGWSGLNVTDAEIASWFATRNVRVQFVRGWQDGLVTGGALNAAFPGGIAATPFLTALPSSVNFLAYPAGSIAVARQDVVTLTNVYDAATLATNQFTSLFAEEGFAAIYPCQGQRLYTVAGCNAGVAGANSIDCVISGT